VCAESIQRYCTSCGELIPFRAGLMGFYNRFPERDVYGVGAAWKERMECCERMGLITLTCDGETVHNTIAHILRRLDKLEKK
jgi:hypothetical protein